MCVRYKGFMPNDFINGEGVCVSFWVQGCPHHCEGCFNPETWDFKGGNEIPSDIKGRIVKAISANGIERNFSILGGEPLAPENKEFVLNLVEAVRSAYPHIKIFLWTGYNLKTFIINKDTVVNSILDKIDVVIDNPFEKDKVDLTLKLRGSSNQNIYRKQEDGSFQICNN